MKIKFPAAAALVIHLFFISLPSAVSQNLSGDADAFFRRVRRYIEDLVAIGSRSAGTKNEIRSAEYIVDQFKKMGIPASMELFEFESFEPSAVEARIGNRAFIPVGLGMNPYSGEKLDYFGGFFVLDPRNPASWPSSEQVEGKAVVTSSNDDPSFHFRIAALRPRFIVVLSSGDFDHVRKGADRKMEISVQGKITQGTSANVSAHLGMSFPAPQIIVGAHLDAYRGCPGAGDNASGVAALLELARSAKSWDMPEEIGLTFVAFGAEEVGFLGSRRYVEKHAEELKRCFLSFIFDDVAGEGPIRIERNGGRRNPVDPSSPLLLPPNYQDRAWEGIGYPWRLIPPPSLYAVFGNAYHPDWLVESIDEAVKETKLEIEFMTIPGSDQMAFAQTGIATSGVTAPSRRAHTKDDLPETVDIEKIRQGAEIAGRIIRKAAMTRKPPQPEMNRSNLTAHVQFLSSDELRGRQAGTAEGNIAARYIAERFRASGVAAFPEAPDYFQDVAWRRGDCELHAPNVIGFIRGRRTDLAGEFVLLTAHYDHLGVQEQNGVKTVYPGARDNAMGVAALLAAAANFALHPPARSVIVLATTAEEEGLIGSRFFVDHALIPLSRIVFVLNNDGAGVFQPEIWSIGGLERTTAESLAEAAGRVEGLITQPYPAKYRSLFLKGDAASFADRGIPSLTVSPGFAEGDEERIKKFVHTPADRVNGDFDSGYLVRFARAYYRLARAIADAECPPGNSHGSHAAR